jgi:uncharacterized protein DUF2213
MIGYCASKISEHMGRDGAGQLVCLSAVIAREGTQQYKASELGISNCDDVVEVVRPASEVFSRAAMASFEGLPLTDDHPGVLIQPSNWSNYARGHVQNVREGKPLPSGERALIADLIVSDGSLISKIEAGKRDISCGYTCEYYELSDGTWAQCNLRGNHVSIVQKGRALNTKVLDSGKDVMTREELLAEKINALAALLNAETASRRRRATDAPNLARKMVRSAADLSQRMATVNEGPQSLHRFIVAQQDSAAFYEAQRQAGADFEAAANAAGRRARGEPTRDCRPSLRRATDASEDWDVTARRMGARMRGERV